MASSFGTERNVIGSNPIVTSASTSSFTCIVPISASKADPDLPATRNAVMIGPSSRTIDIATRSATYRFAPNCRPQGMAAFPCRPLCFGGRIDLPDTTDPATPHAAASGSLSPSV